MKTFTLNRDNPKSQYSWMGTVATIAFIVIGIYMIFKFHKSEGFWYGFLSLFLITSYLFIDSDGFVIGGGGLSLETSQKSSISNDTSTLTSTSTSTNS